MRPLLVLVLLFAISPNTLAQELYRMPANTRSSISSFENPNGKKGAGGQRNKTAKGNAFERLKAGESKTLLELNEPGIIQRMWFTVQNRTPELLRSMRLQMFWDGSSKAAVDVPFGDFFVSNLGSTVSFESALFSSPEGRSYNCYISMPFRKSARIVITNEGTADQRMLYYDIDYILTPSIPADALYFHAYWNRQPNNPLKKDFEVLPGVKGRGRFLGMSVGVNANPVYDKTWWGEGEVKMFVDGDTKFPTINGTGTEDYIGTGWGLGTFSNWYQGSIIANDSTHQYVFYRWHLPDAVYFNKDLRITLQEIGGGDFRLVKKLYEQKIPLEPVTVDGASDFTRLLEMEKVPLLTDKNFPEGWVNFYRIDDYSSVSYFYLDKPFSNLPSLAPIAARIESLK
jgi:Protein of unknown function (DUF2961)